MRLITISPESQQRLAVFVPLAALAVALFIVYPAWGRYKDLEVQVGKERTEWEALKAAPMPRPGPVRPAVPDMPAEPSRFLGDIAAMAAVAGCSLVGLENLSAQSSGDAAQTSGLLRNVRAKVELDGQYPQVRQFLVQLKQARRLYVVTDLSLTNSSSNVSAPRSGSVQVTTGLVHANIEIERYIEQTPKALAQNTTPGASTNSP